MPLYNATNDIRVLHPTGNMNREDVATIRLTWNMEELNNSSDIRSRQSCVVQDDTWHPPDEWETAPDQNVPYRQLQGMWQQTYSHAPSECGAGQSMWKWIRKVIARMLCMTPAKIPNDWLLRPQFYLWTPQRQRAVLWVLSRFVTFRINHQRVLTLHDLMDFLTRSKWKMYQSPSRHRRVANFLTVLNTTY